MTGKTLGALLGLAILLAACSGSTNGHGSTPPSHATLAGIPVLQSDLPAGWKGTPSTDRAGEATASAQMDRCVGAQDTTADQVDAAYADDYTQGNATISSNAKAFKSQADVARDTALLSSPKVGPCYEQVLRGRLTQQLPENATIDNVSVHITPGSDGGPANLEATGAATIKLTAQGQHLSLFADIAFISGPLVEAQVSFEDIGEHIPEALQRSVINAVAKRAAQA
jgi:hypothetical protein